MTDASLRRSDVLLTELTELVETARAVPMSSSCVVPREHLLDLLDDLREVLPPEMIEARALVAQRDTLIADARDEAARTLAVARDEAAADRAAAQAEAADTTQRATEHANGLVAAAQAEAAHVVEAGKAENARLVSAAGVHQAAVAAAEQLQAEADSRVRAQQTEADGYAAEVRGQADQYAGAVRGEADGYAAGLRGDADGYAQRTLSELIDTLHRAAATAERGRTELARRAGPGRADGAPGEHATGELFDQQG